MEYLRPDQLLKSLKDCNESMFSLFKKMIAGVMISHLWEMEQGPHLCNPVAQGLARTAHLASRSGEVVILGLWAVRALWST